MLRIDLRGDYMVKRTILKTIGLLVLSGSLWFSLAIVPVNADSIKATVGSNQISAVEKAKPKKATKKQVKVAIKKKSAKQVAPVAVPTASGNPGSDGNNVSSTGDRQ